MKRYVTYINYAVFLLLTAGCSVHSRQSVDLPVIPPDSYREDAGKEHSGQPIEYWWKTFHDSKLDILMEEAFSENLDLAQAYARLEQLEAVSRSTVAAQYPSLNGEVQGSREDTPGFFGNNIGDSYRLSLAAGFELDIWQKLRSRAQAADFEMKATQEEVKSVYLSLSAELVDLYYLAVEQRAQLVLADQTIASFTDTLDRVERRYREGLVSALDVYQARQNLAGVRASRQLSEASLAVAEHALSVLIGRYPDRKTGGQLAIIPGVTEAFPAGLPSQLLARRPDVQSAFLRIKASDEQVAAAIADRFPSFNLLGNYGKSSTAFSTGDITGSFWNLTANIAQPIIDGGRRKAEVDRTRAVFRENVAFYQKAVLAAFKDVEDALVRSRTTRERVLMLKDREAAASGALRLSLERYMMGLSDYLPVLTAQGLYFNARSSLLEGQRQMISDRIQLARSLGGTWMTRELENRFHADISRKETDE
ncbi:MAG: efflux transporter outer membrane subunit [Nitrospiraceae bacterium]|nr:MAG: efflux transporter outer membrane subunit [Nitrospiraceae bacterium]